MTPIRRLLPLLLATAASPASAQWTVEALGGNAWSMNTRLNIRQEPSYDRSLKADYETRGFRSPPYYALRAAYRWQGEKDEASYWEAQLLHHKLYLKNPPDGVSSLSMSHGFNIVSFNGVYRTGNWVFRFGGGPVVTHAEGSVNGVTYDGRYELSGFAGLMAVARRFPLRGGFFASLEGMVTAAYAKPELRGNLNGELKTTNIAIHALAGVGYEF